VRKTGDCDLQALAYKYEVDGSRFEGEQWDLPIREDNPFITYEPNSVFYVAGASGSAMKLLWQGP